MLTGKPRNSCRGDPWVSLLSHISVCGGSRAGVYLFLVSSRGVYHLLLSFCPVELHYQVNW